MKIFRIVPRIEKKFWTGLWIGMILFGTCEYLGDRVMSFVRLRSEEHKSLYTLGQLYGRRIESMRFSRKEADLISEGFHDWIKDKTDRADFQTRQAGLQKFLASRLENQGIQAKKDGETYLTHYLESGGKRTLSGLAYKILTAGNSIKPKLNDWVEVRYQGRLIDGKIIDGTNAQGDTTKLPLNGTIAGWAEGLQLVGEGGEIELVVPCTLAYGDTENASGVPAGSTLVFKIQLVRVITEGLKHS